MLSYHTAWRYCIYSVYSERTGLPLCKRAAWVWPSLGEQLLLLCLTSKSLSVACVHSAHCYHWMTIHSTSQVYWLSSRSAACDPGSQCARRRVEDFNTDTMVRFASLKGKDRSAWCLIAGRHLFSQLHREQPNHSELLHLLCNRSNSNLNAEAHYSLQHMFKCHFPFPVSHYVRLRGLSEYYRGRDLTDFTSKVKVFHFF